MGFGLWMPTCLGRGFEGRLYYRVILQRRRAGLVLKVARAGGLMGLGSG